MTKRLPVFFALLAVFALVLSACAPATEPPVVVTEPPVVVTEPPVVVTEPPAAALGTPENPLIMALAPSAQSEELQLGGEAIAAKLSEITGYTIEVSVPASYLSLIHI